MQTSRKRSDPSPSRARAACYILGTSLAGLSLLAITASGLLGGSSLDAAAPILTSSAAANDSTDIVEALATMTAAPARVRADAELILPAGLPAGG